ncbi:MAG: hypothetical protein KKB13_30740 [Chloroflexi bacterium]|nr:hypothetical protein [Chloroflexota bacterium]
MKTIRAMQGQRLLIGVLIVGLLLALAVGLPGTLRVSQAQGPVPEGDTPAGDQAGAAVDDVIPIQGRLTDASGASLNGTYGIQANIYDAGGTFLCGDWQEVTVTDGLFSMNVGMGLAVPCQSSQINGDELYLGITVGPLGTLEPEMTPRQPIYPVPYAWTVRPGAVIKGANSYVFVPGSAFVKNNDTDSTRWDMQVNGAARVYRGATAGAKYIFIPITLPGVLYGQAVTVKSITVYYRCENGANNYITGTSLTKQTAADSYASLLGDGTDRTSNTATSYTLNLTTNNVLSSSQGVLGLYLTLAFANDAEYIQIGGVRLLLSHQ